MNYIKRKPVAVACAGAFLLVLGLLIEVTVNDTTRTPEPGAMILMAAMPLFAVVVGAAATVLAYFLTRSHR